MNNPWTNSTGMLALIGAGFGIYQAIASGSAPDTTQLMTIFYGITTGVGLLKAKDWNVTGGTKPQTKEAIERADSPVLK